VCARERASERANSGGGVNGARVYTVYMSSSIIIIIIVVLWCLPTRAAIRALAAAIALRACVFRLFPSAFVRALRI